MDFDLVIRNATVIDGTGTKRYQADLGLLYGKIAAISQNGPLQGAEEIDAAGWVVSPGFIDIHSHADWIFPQSDHDLVLAPLLLQGITTVVAGQCGFSPAPLLPGGAPVMDGISEMLRDSQFDYRWCTFGEFVETLNRDGLLMNAALLVGHGSLRAQVMGSKAAPPTPQELDRLCALTRQSLREGALGISVGLAYAPGVFATNEELLPLLKVAAEEGGLFTAHGRAYSWVSPLYKPMFFGTAHNIRSVRELLGLGRQAGVRLQLSHQIFVGRRTWPTYKTILQEIEQAAHDGQDVAFDVFPYTVGNSTVKVIFPAWFLDGFEQKVNDPASLRRLKLETTLLRLALGIRFSDLRLMSSEDPALVRLNGMDFETISRELGMPPFEAYMHVARLSRGQANALLGTYSGDDETEEPLQAAMKHPLSAIMTDTILTSHGAQNPASYGTFPRLLGRYSRDLGLFSLEEAVRKCTSYSAERMGLQGVGRIAEGCRADLVLFDPLTIADNTTPSQTDLPPSGIKMVMVGGSILARDGKLVSESRPGRVLV